MHWKPGAMYWKPRAMHWKLRLAAIVEPGETAAQPFTVTVYQDAGGGFKAEYGSKRFAMLVRPDGHLAWRASPATEGRPGA
jgi:hypothetical protein